VNHEHSTSDTASKTLERAKKKIGLALAGIGLIGTAGCGGEAAPTPEREPSVSASADPGEVTAENPSVDYEPSELSAETLQDGDALMLGLHDEYNKWMVSGINLEDEVDWTNPDGSIRSISEQYDEKYTNTLLVGGWENNSALAEVISSFKEQHAVVLNASIMTTDSNQPEDIEPYAQGYDVTDTEVLEESPDKMVVSSTFTMWSNADKNRGDAYIENVNGRTDGQVVTFVNQDGVWKVAEIIPMTL
jgi:hypothetical protein